MSEASAGTAAEGSGLGGSSGSSGNGDGAGATFRGLSSGTTGEETAVVGFEVADGLAPRDCVGVGLPTPRAFGDAVSEGTVGLSEGERVGLNMSTGIAADAEVLMLMVTVPGGGDGDEEVASRVEEEVAGFGAYVTHPCHVQ